MRNSIAVFIGSVCGFVTLFVTEFIGAYLNLHLNESYASSVTWGALSLIKFITFVLLMYLFVLLLNKMQEKIRCKRSVVFYLSGLISVVVYIICDYFESDYLIASMIGGTIGRFGAMAIEIVIISRLMSKFRYTTKLTDIKITVIVTALNILIMPLLIPELLTIDYYAAFLIIVFVFQDWSLTNRKVKNTYENGTEQCDDFEKTIEIVDLHDKKTDGNEDNDVILNKKRYCKYCGAEIDFKTKRCSGCGKEFRLIKRFFGIKIKIGVVLLISTFLIGLNSYGIYKIHMLNEEINSYEDRVVRLRERRNEYQEKCDDMEEKVRFYDSHVVIAADDGSNRYHRYGCIDLDIDKGFWIFHENAAKEYGFSPCKYCM